MSSLSKTIDFKSECRYTNDFSTTIFVEPVIAVGDDELDALDAACDEIDDLDALKSK
jgi:hypothetical protein